MAVPTVTWFDDFLGVGLHPAYAKSFGGSGAVIDMSNNPGTSGSVRLWTGDKARANARLRMGEEPVTGGIDVRNWNVTHSVVLEARVFFNRNTFIAGTVGFVGNPDPKFVAAAIFSEDQGKGSRWGLQCVQNGTGTTQDAGWVHTPGTWAEFRIVTTTGNPPSVSLYIDGVHRVTINNADIIPTSDLCSEFQVWNYQMAPDSYSQATMWVDYLSISQNR